MKLLPDPQPLRRQHHHSPPRGKPSNQPVTGVRGTRVNLHRDPGQDRKALINLRKNLFRPHAPGCRTSPGEGVVVRVEDRGRINQVMGSGKHKPAFARTFNPPPAATEQRRRVQVSCWRRPGQLGGDATNQADPQRDSDDARHRSQPEVGHGVPRERRQPAGVPLHHRFGPMPGLPTNLLIAGTVSGCLGDEPGPQAVPGVVPNVKPSSPHPTSHDPADSFTAQRRKTPTR